MWRLHRLTQRVRPLASQLKQDLIWCLHPNRRLLIMVCTMPAWGLLTYPYQTQLHRRRSESTESDTDDDDSRSSSSPHSSCTSLSSEPPSLLSPSKRASSFDHASDPSHLTRNNPPSSNTSTSTGTGGASNSSSSSNDDDDNNDRNNSSPELSDDNDRECPWCTMMTAGPCRDEFITWRNCSQRIQKEDEQQAVVQQQQTTNSNSTQQPSQPQNRRRYVTECMDLFKLLSVCVRTPGPKRDYYRQLLPADEKDEEPTEEEIKKDLDTSEL